jgi:hypothetical protein
MSDATRKTPATGQTAKAAPSTRSTNPPAARASATPAAKTEKPRPRPAMRSDERLIGRSIIGSGAPHKR